MNLRKNKVVQNASWIIVCKIVQSVLGLVVSMLTARYLGPSNFGKINFAASLVAFVSPIMFLGMSEILVQEIVNKPESEGEAIGSSIIMCLCSSFFCILGICAFVKITSGDEPETLLICLLYSFILIFQAIELIQYWFQAKLLSKYSSINSLIAYLIVAGYRIFLLATKKSIYWFAVANALDSLIIALVLVVIYYKIGQNKLSFSFDRCKTLFSKGKYYIISNLMLVVFAQTDRIMLKMMIDDAATGYYSAAVNSANLTAFVFVAVINSVRPTIFESRKISEDKFEKNVSRLYCVIIYAALFQSLIMSILARPIILILYGKDYMTSISALRIVVWYTAFSYIGGIRNIWILAEGKHKYIMSINLVGALSNVILNYFLIPIIGVNGAAVASLVTQSFMNVAVGFMIPAIRRNNMLMVNGLNPRLIIDFVKNRG